MQQNEADPDPIRRMNFLEFISTTRDMMEQNWSIIKSRMEKASTAEWALLTFSVLAGYVLLYMFLHVAFMDNTPLQLDMNAVGFLINPSPNSSSCTMPNAHM